MKRFIPFLVSLITLASCTGMLDDMQSQIDDLDSRVTALEKDSKLISENLSTVKKDLESGLKAIVALQKSTAEIADTLAARKARLQNDMEVSFSLIQSNAESISNLCNDQYRIQNDLEASSKLIQTALDNIKTMDITDSELAQSIVDAYAAIDVVTNLVNQNSTKISSLNDSDLKLSIEISELNSTMYAQVEGLKNQISSMSLRLSALESTAEDICTNCVFSEETFIEGLDAYVNKLNKNGFILYSKMTCMGCPPDIQVCETWYNPGKIECKSRFYYNSSDYTYCSDSRQYPFEGIELLRTSTGKGTPHYFGSNCVIINHSSEIRFNDASRGYANSIMMFDEYCDGYDSELNYDKWKGFENGYGFTIFSCYLKLSEDCSNTFGLDLAINIDNDEVTCIFLFERQKEVENSRVIDVYAESEYNYHTFQILQQFFKKAYYKVQNETHSFDGFISDWNSFVDSVDFLDDSFKVIE